MPPRSEFVKITEREWEALTNTLETLNKAVERLEREQLVFKAKVGVWMALVGAGAGLFMSVATHFVTKLLH